jgi:hypothetical protein
MTQNQKEEYVAKIWTDPRHPAAFAGPDKLYDVIRKEGKYNIGLGIIRKILSKKETYSLQITWSYKQIYLLIPTRILFHYCILKHFPLKPNHRPIERRCHSL